jgi:hypothetical protein
MAQVRLGRFEVEKGKLPLVCMFCGADASLMKRRSFAWHPRWAYILLFAGLLPFVIAAMMLTKRMRVEIPLCQTHKNHWFIRGVIIWVSFLGMVGLTAAWLALLFVLDESVFKGDKRFRDLFGGLVCGGLLFFPLAWLISIPIIQNTGIHATEITDRSITLTRVSPTFVEALREQRSQSTGGE